MKKTLQSLMIIVITVALTSCATYSAKPLCDLSITTEKQHIGIAAKALDGDESCTYLGQNLLASGIQPIQLYIENDSDEAYIFNAKNTNLTILQSDAVAKSLHTNTTRKAMAWVPASLATLTIGAMGCALSKPTASEMTPLFLIARSLPLSAGIQSVANNSKLDHDYKLKGTTQMTIEPHSSGSCVLFTKSTYLPSELSIQLESENQTTLELSTEIS